MTERAEKFWLDFRERGMYTERIYERLFELASNPIEIYSFTKAYLENYHSGSTLFDASLSYISKGQFEELLEIALVILKKRENELAQSVIYYAILQFPELMTENLNEVLELYNEKYYNWSITPGRNFEEIQIEKLLAKFLRTDISKIEKQKIFEVLIQTRNLPSIEIAFKYALENNLFESLYPMEDLITHIECVGLTMKENTIVSYCPNIAYHFVFPKNYFSKNEPIWLDNKSEHPTWKFKASTKSFKFGGYLEKDLKNPFYHIITFDIIPEGIKVTNLKMLTLGLHINLLNEQFGPFFYTHDAYGKPSLINNGINYEIKYFDDDEYKEREVAFAQTPSRWRIQDWGMANSRENLFRLGGEPTAIQSPEVLICPNCKGKMDFFMQLDTGGDFFWGTGGICYIYWCDKDKVSGYCFQCT
ncbi:hypothetical protein [Lacihabitans lacunae]|uniref:DUF1963 domain-containing protein n=1 Tax=Lacihabitans lacunae TaxID=1028214 RepID=A0ABV7YRB1_9BACT